MSSVRRVAYPYYGSQFDVSKRLFSVATSNLVVGLTAANIPPKLIVDDGRLNSEGADNVEIC